MTFNLECLCHQQLEHLDSIARSILAQQCFGTCASILIFILHTHLYGNRFVLISKYVLSGPRFAILVGLGYLLVLRARIILQLSEDRYFWFPRLDDSPSFPTPAPARLAADCCVSVPLPITGEGAGAWLWGRTSSELLSSFRGTG